jgi:hypothetical protein
MRGEKWKVPQPFEKVLEAWPGWSKTDNWRIAREMTPEELNATDLGEFLQRL